MSCSWSLRLCAPLLCALLNSCAVNSKPLDLDEHLDNINNQLTTIKAQQVQLNEPLQLNHAIAIAIKQNLTFQTAALNRVLLYEELDQARRRLLPLALSSNVYTGRDRHSGTVRNNGVITSAASQDAVYGTSQLNLSWDLLNFGISYTNAQQISNQLLIEKENQRLATQSLVAQVKHQYWQALAADQLRIASDQLKTDIASVEKSSVSNKVAKSKKNGAMLDLAQIRLEINEHERDAYLQKTRFKQLLNISVEQPVQLVEVDYNDHLQAQQFEQLSLALLEKQALIYRPELRIASYQKRMRELDIKKQIFNKLPNIKFLYDYNWDSSSKVSNNTWSQWGVEITQNLLDLVPLIKKSKNESAQTKAELIELKNLSLTLAVLSQVHLDYYQLGLAQQHFLAARQLAQHQRVVSRNIKSKSSPTGVNKIKQQWQAIKARKQKLLSYAQLQLLTARLFSDIGGAALLHNDISLDAKALALAVRDPIPGLLQAQNNTLTLKHELITLSEEMPTVAQRNSPVVIKKPEFFYTIQLVESQSRLNLQQLLNVSQAPQGTYQFRSVTNGNQFALTFGNYIDYQSAQAALKNVPWEMQHYQPWIRALEEYQD